MVFIKKNYLTITALALLGAIIACSYFNVIIPMSVFWLLATIVFVFVTWMLVRSVIKNWREAKDDRARKKVIITSAVILVTGVAVFCVLRFSGLSKILFPGYY
jgi:Na+/H+ antiporter NhaD/arsenite permease-like protein